MSRSIVVDGTSYYAAQDSAAQLLALVGRWNIVGLVEQQESGDLLVHDGSVIEYWGTTEGLGELVASGPTDKTRLRALNGPTRIPRHALVFATDTEPELWGL